MPDKRQKRKSVMRVREDPVYPSIYYSKWISNLLVLRFRSWSGFNSVKGELSAAHKCYSSAISSTKRIHVYLQRCKLGSDTFYGMYISKFRKLVQTILLFEQAFLSQTCILFCVPQADSFSLACCLTHRWGSSELNSKPLVSSSDPCLADGGSHNCYESLCQSYIVFQHSTVLQ